MEILNMAVGDNSWDWERKLGNNAHSKLAYADKHV